MDIQHHQRRLRAGLIALLFGLTLTANAATVSLLRFDFEQPDGSFTAAPSQLDPGLISAIWSDDTGALTNFAGVTGRALATSGFTVNNALHLDIEIAPGLALVMERLVFALRVSASGPTSWRLERDGLALASGPATADFTAFDLALASTPAISHLRLDLRGFDATARAGNLRLDNVQLFGQLVPVSLPGPLFLLATPLLGLVAGQWFRRGAQSPS